MIRAVVAIAVLVAGTGRIAAQPPGQQVAPAAALARVEATYASTQQLTARFDQTVFVKAFGQTTKSAGKLYVARPGKMRWDYDKAKAAQPDPSFIFDGATLWIVERSKLQVTKAAVGSSRLPAALTFLTGAGKLSKEFDVAAAPTERLVPGGVVLALTPKQTSAQFAKVYLVIDPSTWRVDTTIVVNTNGDETRYAFTQVNPKARLDVAKTFTFSPATVPTFKVIDAAKP